MQGMTFLIIHILSFSLTSLEIILTHNLQERFQRFESSIEEQICYDVVDTTVLKLDFCLYIFNM